ncbi:MAG TPA: class I SAM-dependent RNA methyltransferase [Mycobacteriales bacterium]|nr:class I SAM-dependent RNA methyltransferase [Mycobacteriales bacterium]
MILDIERVAHGGVCVAHAPDGRVVFVRHTLPGERVRVTVTEERRSYLRADAVEVMTPASARVRPPCRWAGPGRCGGCDWQHVGVAEQRRLKAVVVSEQLQRLAGLDREVEVEPVPGDVDGLHWRTRMRFAVDDDGRAGLRRHRSHDVVAIDDCLIAVPAARVPDLVARSWPADSEVSVDVSSSGEHAIAMGTPKELLTERAAGRDWRVPVGGFWQVHPAAADVLAEVVGDYARPGSADRCLDLYSGVGLFAGVLAPRTASVVAVESDARAVAAAELNLADDHNVTVVRDRVDRWLRRDSEGADVVVLDPPRKGAGRAVVDGIAEREPRAVVYVACDPAALARDVASFAKHGYELDDVRAFDLFPMTAHVECVARLVR